MPRLSIAGAVAAFGAVLLHPSLLAAQGTDTGTGLSQDRREGTTRSAVVHVGAGTTSASTTGYSGQRETTTSPPDEIEPPPLPGAALCDAYREKPGFAGCLSIALPSRAGAQP
jgi:hypothetical protein